MTTTIKDVARKAGVSTATVSRTLNNVGPVDEKTRHHVRMIARKLNYIPNALGRGLSTKRTGAIGLLLPDLFGEFFSEILRGSDQTAQQSHFHLLFSNSHTNKDELRAALLSMSGRVDGLVIMSPYLDRETLNQNVPQSLPVVLLDCHVDSDGFDSINIDNFDGALEMTQHLLSHGHRRIAIITGTEGNFDAGERLHGYREALHAHGVQFDPQLQVPGDFTEASGYDAAKKLLALSPRPSAIFASNDSMAIGALSALRDQRIQLPEEMALAGFDDVPIAAYLTPNLSSVQMDIHNLGVQAIQTAVHAICNKNVHRKQQVVLKTRLSLRESCGCASKH